MAKPDPSRRLPRMAAESRCLACPPSPDHAARRARVSHQSRDSFTSPTGERRMLNRRHFVASGAAVLAFGASAARADNWKSKYKELTFAVVPAENASGVSDRYT